jgi:hypothetical protein
VRKNLVASCDFTAGDEFWMVGDNYEEEAGYLIIQTILEDVTRICKSLKYISKSAIEEADRDNLELANEQYVNINDDVVWELGDEDTTYLLAEKWNLTNDTIKIFNKNSLKSVSVSNVITSSTNFKDSSILILYSIGFIGLSFPFNCLTLSSESIPTSTCPSVLAYSNNDTCPICNTSKQPFTQILILIQSIF